MNFIPGLYKNDMIKNFCSRLPLLCIFLTFTQCMIKVPMVLDSAIIGKTLATSRAFNVWNTSMRNWLMAQAVQNSTWNDVTVRALQKFFCNNGKWECEKVWRNNGVRHQWIVVKHPTFPADTGHEYMVKESEANKTNNELLKVENNSEGHNYFIIQKSTMLDTNWWRNRISQYVILRTQG